MSRSIFTISLILLLFGGVSAGIIKVPENHATIQAGIDAAVNGDTVLVNTGTYYENINFKGKAITVASYFYAEGDTDYINSTIIDGSRPSDPNKGSVVSFTSGEDTTSVICGFTITGGTGTIRPIEKDKLGGGIYCFNSGALIANNKISANMVESPGMYIKGGGLAAESPSSTAYVVLKHNKIEHNTVIAESNACALGGGVCLVGNAKMTANLVSYNTCIANEGSMQPAGGGIMCVGEAPYPCEIIMENNIITHNSAQSYSSVAAGPALSGGVFIERYNGKLVNNQISFNSALQNATNRRAEAGGMCCVNATLIMESNKITHNSLVCYSDVVDFTAIGGGCYFKNINGQFSRNQVSHNKIWVKEYKNGTGAGMHIYQTAKSFIIEIEGNIINENAITNGTGWGGGVYFDGCNSFATNNIVAGNSATKGGGITIGMGSATKLINNTVIKNTGDMGGGLYLDVASKAYLMNTILWDNQAATGSNIYVESGGLFSVAYCDIQGGWSGTGNINADPLFADTLFHLSDKSPCIAAGIASMQIGGTTYNCPNTDIAGNPRPNPPGSWPDIGAYENPLMPDYDACVRLTCNSIPLCVPIRPAAEISNCGQNNGADFDVACAILCNGQPLYADTTHVPMLLVNQTSQVQFKPFITYQKTALDFVVAILNYPNDYNAYNNRIQSTVGVTNLVDDFEKARGYWIFEGGWGITQNFGGHSNSRANVHNNNGITPYENNMDARMTFVPGFHFQMGDSATFSYWTTYITEQDKDICYLELSADSLTWIKADSISGKMLIWNQRQVSLTQLIAAGHTKIWTRFHFISDGQNTDIGVLVDDIAIYSESATKVQELTEIIPNGYSLTQNYPNPFNPATTIEFALPKSAFVTLKVYNLLGEEVAKLIAEQRSAGIHKFNWDARGLASGVYLYRLETGQFAQVKKLILMR